MAVPKKRTGHSAQGHRRSNWKATVPETTTCKNCGALVLTHTVCTECGYYKGKPASIKAEGNTVVEEVKEEKKAPKKTAKKAEQVETAETPAEETSEEKTEE
ncbi:MAG: 50S ribosomal protein L32 [Candidatus Gastranaerophilales bacterium]|nr:50S ribosomal protein L32 [Candidatus Gastranaerophilales bacterium]